MDELNGDQMLMLDKAIKELVAKDEFRRKYIGKTPSRNEAEKTFYPEDNIDYYYGRSDPNT